MNYFFKKNESTLPKLKMSLLKEKKLGGKKALQRLKKMLKICY